MVGSEGEWLFEAPLARSRGLPVPPRGRRPALPRIRRGVGEIKSAVGGERGGVAQLLGRHTGPYPGAQVLITYDVDAPRGIAQVRMATLDRYGGGRWRYVGFVRVCDILPLLPGSPARFGTAIEGRVRALVLRKTGRWPSRIAKHGNAGGPDVVWEYRF